MVNVRSTLLVLTLTLVGTVPSYAVDNVRKTTLEINGTTYTFPVGDKEREMDTYWLKKAVGGDREALDMFLGGADERLLYIGDDLPAWLLVKRNGTMEII